MKTKHTQKIKRLWHSFKLLLKTFFIADKSTNGWLIAPFIDEEGRVL